MKTFRYRFKTKYETYRDASYGIIRAATRLDKYVNVTVDSLLVEGEEDSPVYVWYFEIEAESAKIAASAIILALDPFPIVKEV